jgi:hypothetical protein
VAALGWGLICQGGIGNTRTIEFHRKLSVFELRKPLPRPDRAQKPTQARKNGQSCGVFGGHPEGLGSAGFEHGCTFERVGMPI